MHAFIALAVLGGYSFTVDGRAEALPLTTLSDGAAVVEVYGVPLWLDGPGAYAFTFERGFIRLAGQPVGLVVDSPPDPFGDILGGEPAAPAPAPVGPELTRAELAGLRGVMLKSGATLDAEGLEPAHLCVRLGDGRLGGAPPVMPKLSPVCLVQGNTGVPKTARQAARFLTKRGIFSVSEAKESKRVEVLRVEGAFEAAGLKSLTGLTELSVTGFDEKPRPWAGTFARLTTLELVGQNTSSLAGLDAPKLQRLTLDERALTSLPKLLPALEVVSVVAPKVAPAELTRFEQAHPKAQVLQGWAGRLRAAVGAADRVRVRSGGLCHRDHEKERVLVDRTSKEDVARLLATVELDEAGSSGFCMCCGGPTLEFFSGTELVGTVGVQHGTHLRWRWEADAKLKGEAFVKLLATWGVTGPLEERSRDAGQ